MGNKRSASSQSDELGRLIILKMVIDQESQISAGFNQVLVKCHVWHFMQGASLALYLIRKEFCRCRRSSRPRQQWSRQLLILAGHVMHKQRTRGTEFCRAASRRVVSAQALDFIILWTSWITSWFSEHFRRYECGNVVSRRFWFLDAFPTTYILEIHVGVYASSALLVGEGLVPT